MTDFRKNDLEERLRSMARSAPGTDALLDLISQAGKGNDLSQESLRLLNDLLHKELRIEQAMEKVRACALVMKEPADMTEICRIIAEQLDRLEVRNIRNVQTAIFHESRSVYMNYEYYRLHDKKLVTAVDFSTDPVSRDFGARMLQGEGSVWTIKLEGNELQDWIAFQKTTNVFIDRFLEEATCLHYYWYSLGPVAMGMSTYSALGEQDIRLFVRFRNAFELAYRRWLDIDQAMKQTREALVEAALERVRTRTMAMQRSNELSEVALVLFQELRKLGGKFRTTGVVLCERGRPVDEFWMSDEAGIYPTLYIPNNEDPVHKAMYAAWINGEGFYAAEAGGKELKRHYDYLMTLPGIRSVFEFHAHSGRPMPDWQKWHAAFLSSGYLLIITTEPYDEEMLLRRFAQVFDQAYRRFQDLMAAESQAREARVATALERIRNRTLFMKDSRELTEAALVLFRQFDELGLLPAGARTSFNIFDDKTASCHTWLANPGTARGFREFDLSVDHLPWLQAVWEGWKRGDPLIFREMNAGDLAGYLKMISSDSEKAEKTDSPARMVMVDASFRQGSIGLLSDANLSQEALDNLVRFAKVFEFTYTRYLDLRQAEAQAWEVRIEAALERVRSRTLAMQRSEELAETAAILFRQLISLDLAPNRLFICLVREGGQEAEAWTTDEDGSEISHRFVLNGRQNESVARMIAGWQAGKKSLTLVMEGAELKEYFRYLNQDLQVPFAHGAAQTKRVQQIAYFTQGFIGMAADQVQSEETIRLMERFAAVFNLAYTRFSDLKLAEARARDAVRQASLDRVRAEIASMRTTDDLQRITPLVWRELTTLGVPFFRCGVFIMNDKDEVVHLYLTTPDARPLAVLHLRFDSSETTANTVKYWREQKVYREHWDKERFAGWVQSLMGHGQVYNAETYQSGPAPPESLVLQFIPFPQGMLYVGSAVALDDAEVGLVRALADAFSVAYARYEDFRRLEEAKAQIEATLTRLKATQSQLIQSEKMASLGELTAGIAHEIQNPLNFVNNFSEVSNELLEEMKAAMEKGDGGEALGLVDEVRQNLEKILHHGKRADGIVKGMLQHSRASTGQKEFVDINAMADEYLRLAYHGLRAKDKTFNAGFKTNLDPALGRVSILPQDMGRVLVNLVNNAFYAVTEKKKLNIAGYEPLVTITTRKSGNELEIIVSDNGTGIPARILDKIFQPFFTTKPTGQGTGLGLSLSYEIVTKGHGGEMKVETRESEGTDFIIRLPMSP